MPWRVTDVQALPDYRLFVRFVDGTQGLVDLAQLVRAPNAGVFAPLTDPALFGQVFVQHGAVTWPGEIDLAPDAMYLRIRRSGPLCEQPYDVGRPSPKSPSSKNTSASRPIRPA